MSKSAGVTVRPRRQKQPERKSGVRASSLPMQRLDEHKQRLKEQRRILKRELNKRIRIKQSNGVSLVTPVFTLKEHPDEEKATRVRYAARIMDDAKFVLENSVSPFEVSTWITLCEKTTRSISGSELTYPVWNTPEPGSDWPIFKKNGPEGI